MDASTNRTWCSRQGGHTDGDCALTTLQRPSGGSNSSSSSSSSDGCISRRCQHVDVFSTPVLRLMAVVVVLFLLASAAVASPAPAAVDRHPAAVYDQKLDHLKGLPRYHSQRQVTKGRLETWQVARCRDEDHYVACFLCGKIVQSQEVYYGCCYMHAQVIEFCDQLLA